MKTNHKYRVNVYLGKATFEKLDELAKALQMPLATIVRLMIDNGISVAERLGGFEDGK